MASRVKFDVFHIAKKFLLKGVEVTPIAATTFGKKVNWIAIGT